MADVDKQKKVDNTLGQSNINLLAFAYFDIPKWYFKWDHLSLAW